MSERSPEDSFGVLRAVDEVDHTSRAKISNTPVHYKGSGQMLSNLFASPEHDGTSETRHACCHTGIVCQVDERLTYTGAEYEGWGCTARTADSQ